MRPRRTVAPVAAAAATLLLVACGSPGTPAEPPVGPRIVASTNVYGSIAQAVGANLATVTSLITDPAADPHSYEPTPADVLAVGDATIVVFNGGGYDDFVPRLVEASADPPRRRSVIDVSELSGLRHPAAGGGAAQFNEHVWYSLPTVQKLAGRLAADLGATDTANAPRYTANAEVFTAAITRLADRTSAIGATAPGARVAVTEPVPGHLVEQAGLVDATPPAFAEAIEEDTDPPAAVVEDVLALFTGDTPVRALILNSQTRTASTDRVRSAAEAAGVPVVEMTETLPPGSTDYLTWMSGQVDALSAAVGRTS